MPRTAPNELAGLPQRKTEANFFSAKEGNNHKDKKKRGICNMEDFDDLNRSKTASNLSVPASIPNGGSSTDSLSYSSVSGMSDDFSFSSSEKDDDNHVEKKGRKVDTKSKTSGKAPPQCSKTDGTKDSKVARRAFGKSNAENINRSKKPAMLKKPALVRNNARKWSASPPDKPMILSRRMSYKILNPALSPLTSPITAVKLMFSPPIEPSHCPPSKKRRSNSKGYQHTTGDDKKPSARAKQTVKAGVHAKARPNRQRKNSA